MKKQFRKLKGNKAYYALVAVCITAVGTVVTTVVQDYMKESVQRNLALSEDIVVPEITMPLVTPSAAPSVNVSANTKLKQSATPAPEETQEASVETLGGKFVIDPPVAGQVIQSFSGEELVYDKTFEDWRVHSGIDIAADRSEAVKACAQGVVEEVFMDATDGITIILDHGNQYQSIYQNLSTEKMVKKGETVQKGQAISGVGETGISESGLPSHLHFALKKNGVYVDPILYYEK